MDAEAAQQSEEPLKRAWNWAKAAWWARGVVSAFALAGLLDLLGLDRRIWLPLLHQIGATWNSLVGHLFSWITLFIPGVDIDQTDANVLLILWVFLLPVTMAQLLVSIGRLRTLAARERPEYASRWPLERIANWLIVSMACLALVGEAGTMTIAVLPREANGELPAAWLYLLLMLVSGLLLMAMVDAAYESGGPWFLVIGVLAGVLALIIQFWRWLGISPEMDAILGYIARLSFVVVTAAIVWQFARHYAQAIFVTFTFFLALEGLYYIMRINEILTAPSTPPTEGHDGSADIVRTSANPSTQ